MTWIVDNGSSHRGTAPVKRLESTYANLRLVHLPVHASWLNQVEIYFSVIQRKILTPNDFVSLQEVGQRLLEFQQLYERSQNLLNGNSVVSILHDLIRRLNHKAQLALAA